MKSPKEAQHAKQSQVALCGQNPPAQRPTTTCLNTSTSRSFLSVYKCTTGLRDNSTTGAKVILHVSWCLCSPETLSRVDLSSSPTERGEEHLTAEAGPPLPPLPGSPASTVPPQPYLEQRRCHVEDDEDECECGVPGLHTADGVEEHQVSWNHEKEEDSGRARVHIWDQGRKG